MGSYLNFYQGGDYGFKSQEDDFLKMNYRTPVSRIGLTTDARTANQIKAVGDKLNAGAKTVEVSFLQPNVAESIPNQHIDEINRLKKLVGVDLTLHGPLVEPTGVSRQGWDESQRVQAERQMWSALQRARRLGEKTIVTFHSSNGLPEPEMRIKNENAKEGEPDEIIKEIMVVNERDGQFTQFSPKENIMLGEKADPIKALEDQNKKAWETALTQVSFHAMQGKNSLESGFHLGKRIKDLDEPELMDIYKDSKTKDGQEFLNILKSKNPETKRLIESKIDELNHGEIYVKEAYTNLQEQFNKAWNATQLEIERAEKDSIKKKAQEDLEKLKKYQQEIQNKKEKLQNPENIELLAEEVTKGVNVLNSLSTTPKIFRPLKEFAIDKASDTFSNLAVKAFKEFKEDAPIISIENPPAGMGLSRAEEIKTLIEESRKKFAKIAEKELGQSKSEAKANAEKLIGATWDVGHINMIRKFGYDEKDLKKQAEKIGKFVKHVHLSDNFGMEHTELPMGMGNVPTKIHMDIIDKYNDKVKKIIEAADWYQHFQTTPFGETLSAFGSPIYAMNMAPYWSNYPGMSQGGYFSGRGYNPEIHHSMYGSGFSNLPIELGGQMAGKSRVSGAPID